MDEDRTVSLKLALEGIWKKIVPSLPILDRYPFVNEKPVIHALHRDEKGRFV